MLFISLLLTFAIFAIPTTSFSNKAFQNWLGVGPALVMVILATSITTLTQTTQGISYSTFAGAIMGLSMVFNRHNEITIAEQQAEIDQLKSNLPVNPSADSNT